MTNEAATPEPRKTKRDELVDALELDYVSMALHHSNRAIAERIVDRVIQTGWQWHPYATEENMDFNEVTLVDVNSLYPTEYALRTPEQEVDILDRIVHGLPVEYLTPARPGSTAIYKKQEENIWVRIPDFENYQVNSEGIVRNRWTRRELEVAEDGGKKYVEMHDKDGFAHDVCIDFVMEKVYGK